MILQQSLNQAWTPWFYGKLDTRDYKQIKWLNDKYILLYGVIIAGFMLLAPDVIYLFTEKSYWPCLYSLIPLAISIFAELLYSIPTSVEYYNKKTKYIMTATLITVALNILLDIIFIKIFGYHGAAYATSMSKLVLFLMHLHFSRKLDSNEMFSRKVVVISVLALCILNALIVLTLDIWFLRYIILILMLFPVSYYLLKNRTVLTSKLRDNS